MVEIIFCYKRFRFYCFKARTNTEFIKLKILTILGPALVIHAYYSQNAKKEGIYEFKHSISIAATKEKTCIDYETPFIMVTAASFPCRQFMLNLQSSIKKNGNQSLILVAVDK